jgi:hypothetical protein
LRQGHQLDPGESKRDRSSQSASFGWFSPLSSQDLQLNSTNNRIDVRVEDIATELRLSRLPAAKCRSLHPVHPNRADLFEHPDLSAIGQTLAGHDVPLLGDFTYYLSRVMDTPLSNSDQTRVTLTPGIRAHLGHDWYFLAGLPIPVTKQRVADLGMIFWVMRAW